MRSREEEETRTSNTQAEYFPINMYNYTSLYFTRVFGLIPAFKVITYRYLYGTVICSLPCCLLDLDSPTPLSQFILFSCESCCSFPVVYYVEIEKVVKLQ